MLAWVFLISLFFQKLSFIISKEKSIRSQKLLAQLCLKFKSWLPISYIFIQKLTAQRSKRRSLSAKSYRILRNQRQRKQLILQTPFLIQVQRNLKFPLTLTSPLLPLLKLLQKVLVVSKVPKQFLYILSIIIVFLLNKIFLTILFQNLLNFILIFFFYFIIKTFLYQYTRVSQLKK